MREKLIAAYKQIAAQEADRAHRAGELLLANEELIFQNKEKDCRAAELLVAKDALLFENLEKESREQELIIANQELAFQNADNEKRAAQLHSAYKQLEAFNYITSHDLQEPLRKLQMFTSRMLLDDEQELSIKNQVYLTRINEAALHMQSLIIDLRTYSVASAHTGEHKNTDVMEIIHTVLREFATSIKETDAEIIVKGTGKACVIAFQFQQLIQQLVENAFKFVRAGVIPKISITCCMLQHVDTPIVLPLKKEYCHIRIADNGIGFDPLYKDQIFDIFKRLNEREEFAGTGVGLAIAKKIIENHQGVITATGEVNNGATFDIYIPVDSGTSDC